MGKGDDNPVRLGVLRPYSPRHGNPTDARTRPCGSFFGATLLFACRQRCFFLPLLSQFCRSGGSIAQLLALGTAINLTFPQPM